jgi:phospholipid transport system substrate-binding protein
MQMFCPSKTIAVLALCFGLLTPLTGSAKEADAGAFLNELSREAAIKLGGEGLTKAQKEENFRQLFHVAFDVPAISRFVLGKYWRSASEAEKQDFTAAFEELQMQHFLPQFAQYDQDAVKVESVQAVSGKPDMYTVSSRIAYGEGEPAAVVWRILDTGESYKILDVVAEGVSMAISLRNEYSEIAKAEGVDGLIKQLRDKSAELAVQ